MNINLNEMQKTFSHKLAHAHRGTRIVYYRGDLMFDRYVEAINSPAFKSTRPLNALARLVMKEYEDGRCELFQRRVGPNTWDYIAVKP
jgi:hypothetical protein